jgi:hypothetical protein
MRAARTLAVAVLGASLLGGCGLLGDDDPSADPGGSASGGGSATSSPTPSGPDPAELSEEVLAAAEAEQQAPALGSGTGTTAGGTDLTIEVTAVERVSEGTLVTMRFSGTEGGNLGGPAGFGNERYETQNFARTLYLVDPAVTRTRYLPLQFEDYREGCLCPYFPLAVGAEPQTVTALYPPLPPEVSTIDVVANDFLTVSGLPVQG